jgi:hypothetical protein
VGSAAGAAVETAAGAAGTAAAEVAAEVAPATPGVGVGVPATGHHMGMQGGESNGDGLPPGPYTSRQAATATSTATPTPKPPHWGKMSTSAKSGGNSGNADPGSDPPLCPEGGGSSGNADPGSNPPLCSEDGSDRHKPRAQDYADQHRQRLTSFFRSVPPPLPSFTPPSCKMRWGVNWQSSCLVNRLLFRSRPHWGGREKALV